jgi:hypothetical protein
MLIETSRDVFAEQPIPRGSPVARRRPSPELATARVLCRRLQGTKLAVEKRRIAHLICLHLVTMLRHGPQR